MTGVNAPTDPFAEARRLADAQIADEIDGGTVVPLDPTARGVYVKPLTEYHKNPRSSHGYRTECKACRSARTKAWREANREKIAESNKAYHSANREQKIAAMKAYRESNRERVLAIKRAYREANREKIAESARAYRKANPHVAYAATLRRRPASRRPSSRSTASSIAASRPARPTSPSTARSPRTSTRRHCPSSPDRKPAARLDDH